MILTGKTHWWCDVFDANGVQLQLCTWCDTETGEAVHLVRDESGFVTTIDYEGFPVVKQEWRKHPAPLTWVRSVNGHGGDK